MAFFLRIVTLLTIAAAGFAMPMTCAQSTAAATPGMVAIEIPAAQHFDAPALDLDHSAAEQHDAHTHLERLLDTRPFDCGKTTPRATDHSANFDTQPFVAGYLGSAPMLDDAHPRRFSPPAALIPVEGRAGPPEAPPPQPID